MISDRTSWSSSEGGLPQPTTRPDAWGAILLFLGSMALVALFCGHAAATRAMWTDELFSLATAEETAAEMIRRLAEYQAGTYDQPPLYFLLLRPILIFGNSPLLLRVTSLLFVGAAIGLWSVEVRRRGYPFALAGALAVVMTLHPEMRYQAQQARMYSLVLLLASASAILAWRLAEAEGRRRWDGALALGVCLAMLFYTSYFGLLFGAGLGLLGLVWMARPAWGDTEGRRAGLMVVLACLGGLALYLPWTPAVLRMLAGERARTVDLIANDPNAPSRASQLMMAARMLTGEGAGALFMAIGWAGLAGFTKDRRRWLGLLVAVVILPFTVIAITTPPSREVNARYVIHAIPILLAGAALGWHSLISRILNLAQLPRSPNVAQLPSAVIPGNANLPIGANTSTLETSPKTSPQNAAQPPPAVHSHSIYQTSALAILLLAPLYFLRGEQTYFKPTPDWWAAARIIETNARPEEVILTGGHLSGEALVYHLKRPGAFSFLHYVVNIDPFYVACRDPKTVWFVSTLPPPESYAKILRRYFTYRVEFPGNGPGRVIQVYAKKTFALPWGGESPYFEPVALEYEHAPPRVGLP